MGHKRTNQGRGRAALLAALLATASPMMLGLAITPALSQATAGYSIAAGPLADALTSFGQQSGLQIAFPANLVAGRTSSGASGNLTPAQALDRLLAGTGLGYGFSGAGSVTILDPAEAAPAADGSIVLEEVNVNAWVESAGGFTDESIYETAAAVSHISAEQIDRFRGSSPADIFRGTPGVMSGEARNGAGSIDPNIRGMQGMGRVATTVDGAENNVQIYQGYQGVSNRTFVDPDFIGGIDITKGASASSWGNAGSVAMRTVNADDIIKPGDNWGVKVKGSYSDNTSEPVAGNKGGYLFTNPIGSVNSPTSGYGSAVASTTGMDRPSFLFPTSGSGSMLGAVKGDGFDVVAGYAVRSRGNYHAGTEGDGAAEPLSTGPQPFCYSSGTCPANFLYRDYVVNSGLANYRPGEEVLNTQLSTESWLFKVSADIAEDQTLQLGYTGYRSEAGDRLASQQAGYMTQAVQQAQTTGTSLDTFTARYAYTPSDNPLVNVKANAYWTHLEQRNPIRAGTWAVTPTTLGLPADYRVGSDTDMWGADVSNLSQFAFDHGDLDLTTGLAYRGEDTRGSMHTGALENWLTPRDGIRHELAGYATASYTPAALDWLTLNAGLRYAHYWSKDRVDPYSRSQVTTDRVILGYETDGGGLSPSAGITVEPFEGTQFYVNYANAMRTPSIIESVSAFNSVVANSDVRPEFSRNWEVGTNLTREGLIAADDKAMLKLGYFNWDVKDYLARGVIVDPNSPNLLSLDITNIDRARFSGIELGGRYEVGGFTADLAANYFLNVEYCRTADTCEDKSLYGDYATNHVQPEYSLSLTVSQKLLEDRLTLGGRISHVGSRAIGHGDVTAQGAQQFIAPVLWEPYTLVDVFAEVEISDNLTAEFRIENLFDRYYIDPLGLVSQPGPGRTFSASLTGTLGGSETFVPPFLNSFGEDATSGPVDLTGFYAGVHGAAGLALERGTTTALDGSTDATTASESADLDMASGLFGVQGGYTWQVGGGFVLGVEGDWSKTWMNGRQKAVSTEGTLATAGSTQALTYYGIDWVSTLRGQVGYLVDDGLMIYGTGGVAFARETQSREQYRRQYSYSNDTIIGSVEQEEQTRVGFTVGAGAELALDDNWSINTSYSYSHFGDTDFAFDNARSGADTASYDAVNGRNASNSLDLHAVKVGLNYRF